MRFYASCFAQAKAKTFPSTTRARRPASDVVVFAQAAAGDADTAAGILTTVLMVDEDGATQTVPFPPFLEGGSAAAAAATATTSTTTTHGIDILRTEREDGCVEVRMGGLDLGVALAAAVKESGLADAAAALAGRVAKAASAAKAAASSKKTKQVVAFAALAALAAGAATAGLGAATSGTFTAASTGLAPAVVAPPPLAPPAACPAADWWVVTPPGFQAAARLAPPSQWEALTLRTRDWSKAMFDGAGEAVADKAAAAAAAAKKGKAAATRAAAPVAARARAAASAARSAWARAYAVATHAAATGGAKLGAGWARAAGEAKAAGLKAGAQVEAAAAAVRATAAPVAGRAAAAAKAAGLKAGAAAKAAGLKAGAAAKAAGLKAGAAVGRVAAKAKAVGRVIVAAWVAGGPQSAPTARASILTRPNAWLGTAVATAGTAASAALVHHGVVVRNQEWAVRTARAARRELKRLTGKKNKMERGGVPALPAPAQLKNKQKVKCA